MPITRPVLGGLLTLAACSSSKFVNIMDVSVLEERHGGGEVDWHAAVAEPQGGKLGGVTLDLAQGSFPCDRGSRLVAIKVCAGRSRSCEMQVPEPISPGLWVQYRCGTVDPPVGEPDPVVQPAGH